MVAVNNSLKLPGDTLGIEDMMANQITQEPTARKVAM